MGQADLWFAALFFVLRDADRESLRAHIPYIQRQLMWRCSHCTSFASLCGLPTTITSRVKFGAAVWFCVGGALAECRAGRAKNEAFRMHLGYLDRLREICALQGFQISPACEAHIRRNLVLREIVVRCKQADWQVAKREILALKQNSLDAEIGGRPVLLLLDGPASAERGEAIRQRLPESWREFSADELVAFAQMAHPERATGDFGVAADWRPEPYAAVSKWAASEKVPPATEILEATCRPRC